MGRKRRHPPPGSRSRDIADVLYPTLDLHGLTAAGASSAAKRWIEAQRTAGAVTVRLVTGRGMHSVGPPVLPATVEELLARLTGKAVRSWEREPGGGAYRAMLNRLQPPPQIRPSLSRFPGEVIRQAEESLVDLGITPTPALVEAEVRKILESRKAKGET